MARRGKDEVPGGAAPPSEPGGAGGGKPGFPMHEHIGRTLKALFDEVAAQPIPEKLRALLRRLGDGNAKD